MSDEQQYDNYYRLITLVVKTGTRTFKEVFKKYTADDIASELKNYVYLKGRNLAYPQYQLLIADNPDIDKFDISLLFTLIHDICTSGWKTVGKSIIGIRNIRNEVVGHSSDTKVCNARFKTYWAEAVKCLKYLAADVELTVAIAEEIKSIESLSLTAYSNFNSESTLRIWRVNELYSKLTQLNEKAEEHANNLQTVMDEVSFIRKQIEGGQKTGNSGSAIQQTAPVVNTNINSVNTELDETKLVLEDEYGFCKSLEKYASKKQQTKALPPLVDPNALTDEEIFVYSKRLSGDWELFAIFLGYKQMQIDQLKATFPQQIYARLRTMIQKWHDVVARCEYENPRNLLAASFVGISDNRTACEVLGDGNRLKDLKKTKPSPETTKKIEDIDFDVPFPTQTMHVIHILGPSFEIRALTDKPLEQQQQPGIAGAKTPAIEEGDQKMDER